MKIKFFFAICLTLICIPTSSYGLVYSKPNDSVTSGSAVGDSSVITINEYKLDDSKLRFFEVNDKIDISELCNKVTICTTTGRWYQCDVEWADLYNLDTSTPGRLIINGKIIPPEGYTFSYDNNIQTTVVIYDKNSATEVLKPFDYYATKNPVPVGGDASAYLNDTINLETVNGDEFTAEIEWQNTIAPSTPGEFTVIGKVILPFGIKAEKESDLIIRHSFYAMRDDKIYLKVYESKFGNTLFRWLYNVEDYENAKVLYSFDNDNWLYSEEHEYGDINDNQFLLYTSLLDENKTYYFKILYNGEYTNVIEVKNNGDILIIGGDHDGGDNFNQPSLPIVQRIKTSPKSGGYSKSNDKNERFYSDNVEIIERIDLNTTIMSGKRLLDLVELNNNEIVFEKDDITTVIKGDFVKDNQINENDIISVKIRKGKNNDFGITVNVNNREVKKIPDTMIHIQGSDDDKTKAFKIDETGNYIVDNDRIIKLSDNIVDNYNVEKDKVSKAIFKVLNKYIYILFIFVVLIIHIVERFIRNKYEK